MNNNFDVDPTETLRAAEQARLNAIAADRPALEAEHGRVWSTDELTADFDVTGFLAPFVGVRRKADGKTGSLMFQHSPRFYFGWKED